MDLELLNKNLPIKIIEKLNAFKSSVNSTN